MYEWFKFTRSRNQISDNNSSQLSPKSCTPRSSLITNSVTMKAFLLVVAIVQLSDPSWVLAKEGQHLRALKVSGTKIVQALKLFCLLTLGCLLKNVKKQGGGSPIFKIPAVSYSSVDFDGYSTGDDGSGDKKSKKSGKGKGSSSSSSSKGGKGGKGVSKSSKSSGKGKGHSSVDHSGNSGSESSKSGKENVSSSKGASKSSKSSDKGKGGRSSDSHSGSGSGSSKGKDTKKKPKRSKSSKSSKKGKGGSKSSKSGGKGSRDSSSSSEDKYSSIDEPHYGSSIDEPAPIHERPISPTIPPRVTTPAPVEPRLSPSPSRAPVPEPTNAPVPAPVFTAPPVPLLVDPRLTIVPTGKPTPQPTRKPSFSPTISPTTAPVAPTIPDVRVTPAPTTPPSNDPSLTPTRAPVVTPTDAPTAASEPIYICDICGGEGKVVTIPTGVVSIPTQGEFTCTAIQGAAAAGLIPESGCGPLTVLTQEPCGCEAPNDPTNAPSSSKSTVQLTIEKFALQDGEEFEDPDSYQSVALRRVEAQDGVATMNDSKLAQYYSLYCIFESTNGKSNDMIENEPAFSGIDIPGWTITTGWLENNMDPCDGWHGVECENDQVVSLNLYDNTMTGNFAPEVILLASDGQHSTGAGSLRLLDIFNNEFLSNDGDSSWMESLGSDLRKFKAYLPPYIH